jgi:hypothetical protein
MRKLTTLLLSASLAAASITTVVATVAADAKGRRLGNPVETSGTCTDGRTTFTLKSQFDDEPFAQTVGAEFEVDSGIVGQSWDVTLTDNAVAFFAALVPTTGPEGAFNVTHPDAGAFAIDHTIAARAVNGADGTVCTGEVTDLALR